jgi:hypothetical protein
MLIGTKEAFDAARDWALRHEREHLEEGREAERAFAAEESRLARAALTPAIATEHTAVRGGMPRERDLLETMWATAALLARVRNAETLSVTAGA